MPLEASTKSLNGAQPSISNLLANTEALPANTETTKSSNSAQLSIPTCQQILKQCPTHSIEILYLKLTKRTSAINQGIQQQHLENI